MVQAGIREDKIALLANLFSVLASPASSASRAKREKSGEEVKELNRFFLGSALGRFFASIISFVPEKKVGPISIQAITPIVTGISTLGSAHNRLKGPAIRKASKKTQEIAAKKLDSAIKYWIISSLLGVTSFAICLNHINGKSSNNNS